MATPYSVPVTAAQVGKFFVGQYYQVLQQTPDFVYQFYNDSSTMLRVDGKNQESAFTMLQIHSLIMSLNYTGVEIKMANFLDSWNGGVLVMVSGAVQGKGFKGRRNFAETFFLAPQEHGYFVLNDIFHFIEEEPLQQNPMMLNPRILLVQNNLNAELNNPHAEITRKVSNLTIGEDIHTRNYGVPANSKENCQVDNYSFSEQQLQLVPESDNFIDEISTHQSNGSVQNAASTGQKQRPASVEEPPLEPKRHTYASILRVNGHSNTTASPQHSANENVVLTLEWSDASQPILQQATLTSGSSDNSGAEVNDEVSPIGHEDEVRSVYVRNLLPHITEAEIEEEFKKFGRIVPDGVVIRSRKDIGVCYAFVEFEDMTGVMTAVKAGSASVAGWQVYIEERRPNSNIPFRAERGRGRGRGSYQLDASRGHFGSRNFGGGSDHVRGDREHYRPRGNSYYRPVLIKEKESVVNKYQVVDKANRNCYWQVFIKFGFIQIGLETSSFELKNEKLMIKYYYYCINIFVR